jgi:membrane-associated phospholipid phosphatase
MQDAVQRGERGHRRPVLLAAGLTLLALAFAAGVLVRQELPRLPFAGVDRDWLAAVSELRNAALTDTFKVLSLIGGPLGATILVALLTVFLLLARRWRTALFIALVQICGSTCSTLIKHYVLRPRPPHPLVTADTGSFPSGHVITTLGVGLALTIALTRPGPGRRRALAAVGAATALMMLVRTYLAAHWLTDTFESLPVGAGVALVLWWIFGRWLPGDRDRPLRFCDAVTPWRRASPGRSPGLAGPAQCEPAGQISHAGYCGGQTHGKRSGDREHGQARGAD